MIPAGCNACGRIALELTGQHERLDSYYLEAGGPPADSAGNWHTKCLRESGVGGAWHRARMRNFTDVRGYALVAQLAAWTVIAPRRPGWRVALGIHGALLALPEAADLVEVPGGASYRERTREYNLHLADRELIADVQAALLRDGECPMSMLFTKLGLWPCLDQPDVLAGARFVYDEELREAWGPAWVSAGAECDVFIPAALVPYCG